MFIIKGSFGPSCRKVNPGLFISLFKSPLRVTFLILFRASYHQIVYKNYFTEFSSTVSDLNLISHQPWVILIQL